MADPHRPAISPYITLDPHSQAISPYDLQAPRNPTSNSERPAFRSPQTPNQSNPNKHPEPASHLRKHQANPAPTYPEPALQSSKSNANQFQQILHTCEGGGWLAPPACAYLHVRAHGHGHARAYLYHGHTCTGLRTPVRVCAYLYGYARTFTGMRTAMVICLRVRLRRDQRGRSTQTYASNQLTQIPTSNDWGACTASLRDVTASASTSGGAAPACMIGPEGPMSR